MKRILFFSVGLLFGLAMILVIKPFKAKPEALSTQTAKAPEKPKNFGSFSNTKTTPAAAAPTAKSIAISAEFRKHFLEAGFNEEKQLQCINSLANEDIPAALGSFASGFYGMGVSDRSGFHQLAKAWYLKAPAEAMAWLRTLPDSDRANLLQDITEEVSKTNLDGAITLLREMGGNETGKNYVSAQMLSQAIRQGADKVVELCRLGDAGGGERIVFPEGFDFKRAMDGLAKPSKEPNEPFSHISSTLLKEWAKRDPETAKAWIQQQKQLANNAETVFFEGYIAGTSASEAGALLGKTFKSNDEASRYTLALDVLSKQPSAELLEGFLKNAPGERSAHLEGVFKTTFRRGGQNPEQVYGLLLEQMTPEQRKEALKSVEPYWFGGNKKGELHLVLRRLGHSEEEIKAMLPMGNSESK